MRAATTQRRLAAAELEALRLQEDRLAEARRALARARRGNTVFKAECRALSQLADELGLRVMAAAYSADEPDAGPEQIINQ